MTNKASLLLRSDRIFFGDSKQKPRAGFVAVQDEHILMTGSGSGDEYIDSSTKVFDFGKYLICPGFIDVHCFFTGHAWIPAGGNPSGASSDKELLEKAKTYLPDHKCITPIFRDYMRLLNSRGITSIKEMAFDDFSGFTHILENLQKVNELTLRVHFMSQPSAGNFDLALGNRMQEQYHSDSLFFSGFNLMTDGSISQHCGDLKKPYADKPEVYCEESIDYDRIKKETLAADQEGFRVSLHAQGDKAVACVLDIYNCCQRKGDRLLLRHAITDLELTDPADLEQMGRLGAIAEIYPQIPSLYKRQEKLDSINTTVGVDRSKYYWNRRAMADKGVIISCGTDLPLLYDDIPESIYHAGGGFFADGGNPFNPENTLTTEELLRAWTSGGAWNLGMETKLGTLDPGYLADIAVLDSDIFETAMESMRDIKVCLTIMNGRIVYSRL
jgi:predicted amidohydrolase YtcJ